MKQLQQLKAIFLLGIISILMLHNVVPHVHHSHHEHPVAESHHHHDGGHDHDHLGTHSHHQDSDHSEEDSDGLLWSLFFGDHSHVYHVHEASEYTKRSYSLQIVTGTFFDVDQKQIIHIGTVRDKVPIKDQPYQIYSDPLVSGFSFRGPPSLG